MENLDVYVLRQLAGWRNLGQRALLATVVRTWGSSPRPVGSIMALHEDGAVVGSVSGGCIEDDLLYRYVSPKPGTANQAPTETEVLRDGPPQLVRYGVTADEAHRFGLPCGGTLELLLEFNPDAERLEQLTTQLDKGQLVRRSVDLTSGDVLLMPCSQPQEATFTDGELVNVFGPEFRMLLIGAGQLSEYVATMALFNGFAVTVCDPRPEYSSHWSVAGASVLRDMPDDVVREMRPDSRTCVVALTHDPKLDDLALMEALESNAFYVGAIGSRRNHAARVQRMREHFGMTEAQLARLHGPIGLYIGSKTPSEIAVSVMAEVLAVKNGVQVPEQMQVANAKEANQIVSNEEKQGLEPVSAASCAIKLN